MYIHGYTMYIHFLWISMVYTWIYHVYFMYIGKDGIYMEYTWYIPGIYRKSGFQVIMIIVIKHFCSYQLTKVEYGVGYWV
jgi:hypothetical protein